MAAPKIMHFEVQAHQPLLPSIVNLHADCIDFDNSLLRFHPPFTDEKKQQMLLFWTERTRQIEGGLRLRLLYMVTSEDGTEQIGGMVELGMPEADTGPFRGDVELLMVSPAHRRKGIAKKLMAELEVVAVSRGRTLLQLGTTAGSAAASMYAKLGYLKIGTVPKYGITPRTGELVDGELFYKDLRTH